MDVWRDLEGLGESVGGASTGASREPGGSGAMKVFED